MAGIGKLLIGFGVILIVVGGALLLAGWLGGKVPFVGRLPGDIYIQGERWSFYFPLATSILVSVLLTLALTLLFRR